MGIILGRDNTILCIVPCPKTWIILFLYLKLFFKGNKNLRLELKVNKRLYL
jgi:hypothetical protein